MATAGASAVQSVPRFLLPRLSWRGGHGTSSHLLRAAAILPHDNKQCWQPPSTSLAATIHTSRRTPPRCATPKTTPTQSQILGNLAWRRSFHATAARARDHHFDTLKFVQRLQSEGFTEEQSVAMMRTLNDVIEER